MSSRDSNTGCFLYIIYFVIMGFFVLMGPVWGVDSTTAKRVLTANGYTDIHITGYRWFIGTGDWYHTGYEAKSPNGTFVSGAVTGGLIFKGNTIRFD